MTNEEKALEIGGTSSFGNERYKAALEMANWKDEQSKEDFMNKLDKALDWIQKRRSKYFFTDKMTFDFIDDFKKVMEEEL